MKRADVPLEQFEIQFNPTGLEDQIKSREALVTSLRFLDREILPAIAKFKDSIPQQNDIKSRSLRTAEDGRYLLLIESQVRDFLDVKTRHVEQYLDKALQNLSINDTVYVRALVMHTLDKMIKPLEAIARVTSERFDGFVGAGQGDETLPDESSTTEEAITKAGDNHRTRLDRLFQ